MGVKESSRKHPDRWLASALPAHGEDGGWPVSVRRRRLATAFRAAAGILRVPGRPRRTPRLAREGLACLAG